MKITLLKKLPYVHTGNDVPFFTNAEERDTYLENYSGEIKELNPRAFTRTSVDRMTFRVATRNIFKTMSNTYCKTEIQGKTEYWILTGEISDNGKLVYFTGELDINMTYPNLISQIEGGIMTQGHLPVDKTYGYQLDGGDKEVESVERIYSKWQIDNAIYDNQTTHAFVFLSTRGDSWLTANDTTEPMAIIKDGKTAKMPYVVAVFNLETEYEKFSETMTELAARVIGAKLSTFDPEHEGFTISTGTMELTGGLFSGNDAKVENMPFISQIDTDIESDKDIFEIESEGYWENFEGTRKWAIGIENSHEISIPAALLNTGKVTIIRQFLPTPNETQETFKVIADGYEFMRDAEGIWMNDKEIIYGVNAFDQYGASNPIARSYGVFGAGIKGAIGMGSMGGGRPDASKSWLETSILEKEMRTEDRYSSYNKNGQPRANARLIPGIDYIDQTDMGTSLSQHGKSSIAKGATGAALGVAQEMVKRQGMKARPNKVLGSGTALHDMAWNNYGLEIVKINYKYTTSQRDDVLKDFYRDGFITQGYLFNKFQEIQRQRFTVFDVKNIQEIIHTFEEFSEWDRETIEAIKIWFMTPRRYWSDWENMLKYDYTNKGDNN